MIKILVDKYSKYFPQNEGCIQAVIDMHGHSKKKNIFIYGPYY